GVSDDKTSQDIRRARVAEIFSGSGNLSKALCDVDLPAIEYDLIKSPEHDMYNTLKMEKIRDTVMGAPNIQYIHLAPPCNTFSQARWPKIRSKQYPAGLPNVTHKQRHQLHVANKIVQNTVAIADALITGGKMVSIENPASSLFLYFV
ncbi:unnamed protein product, partial [Symbiodinium sp. CCMP2456]